VQAGTRIFAGIDFDDASHFASVLSRNAGGVDGQRADVIGLNFGTGSRRAIVGQRHSIDHELGLIFGASGMQHRAAFINPSGLGADQVRKRAAGERRSAVGDGLRIDAVDRAGAIGIQHGGFGRDLDGVAHGGDAELDNVLDRNSGADFYEPREG